MIGVVVVTHGQLATELVNAAETIVGDLPHFAAVSIGWHEDVQDARDEIQSAMGRVKSGTSGVLIITDMFGGTPCNLAMTFLARDEVEVVTGVNLPMLIKAASLREGGDAGGGGTAAGDHGRSAIWVATDLLEGSSPPGTSATAPHRDDDDARWWCRNRLGLHARAAAKFVHAATRYRSRILVRRDSRTMDGKSIMGVLLLAAARGTTIAHLGRWARRGGSGGGTGRLVESGFGEAPWSG